MTMFKKNGGFTLVELIVVIAILAILAGVAIPVYSGYIKKANEAADIQTVAAVNTALAAACAENGVAMSSLTDAEATVSSGVVTGVNVTITNANDTLISAIETDFNEYYAGNNAALKHFTGLNFVNGEFEGTVS